MGERGWGVRGPYSSPATRNAYPTPLTVTRYRGSAASVSIFWRRRWTSCLRSWRSPEPREPQTWARRRSAGRVAGVGEQDLEQAQLQAGQAHGLGAAHRHGLQFEVEAADAGR